MDLFDWVTTQGADSPCENTGGNTPTQLTGVAARDVPSLPEAPTTVAYAVAPPEATLSLNHTSPPATITEALLQLRLEGKIPAAKLKEWERKAKLAAKHLRIPLNQLPIAENQLTPLLAQLKANSANIRAGTLLCSPLRCIARAVGPVVPKRANQFALRDVWRIVDCVPSSTFVEALVLIRQRGRVPEEALSRWESDVARGAKLMGIAKEDLPTAPAELVTLLKKVTPSRQDAKSWSNVRSSLRTIAIVVGAHAPRPRLVLSEEWQGLLEPLMQKIERTPLFDFVRWCDERKFSPDYVTEAELQSYQDWRASHTYTLNLGTIISSIRCAWNGASRRVSNWPQRRFTSSTAKTRSPPIIPEDFPSSFQDKLSGYLTSLRTPSGPFEGRGRALSEHTITLYRRQILVAATVRAVQLGGSHEISDLACLVTPAAIRAILEERHLKAGNKWLPNHMHLATALVGVARDHVRSDEQTMEILRGLQSKVRPNDQEGISKKISDRLSQFDDEEIRKDLFTLAGKMCEEAEELRDSKPVLAAHRHRRGILLHILLISALRRGDLIRLHLQDDFVRDDKGRVIRLKVNASKNGVTVEANFSADFSKQFERHLRVFRPLIPGSTSPWLLASRDGKTHASINGQARSLADYVKKQIGAKFNVHLVRHLVATLLFEDDVDNLVVVQRTLGHTDAKTTARMYGRLTTRAGQKHWADLVDDMARSPSRKQAPPKKGRTK